MCNDTIKGVLILLGFWSVMGRTRGGSFRVFSHKDSNLNHPYFRLIKKLSKKNDFPPKIKDFIWSDTSFPGVDT